MTQDELLFFNEFPRLVPIYAALEEQLRGRWSGVRVKVSRTQISFYNRRMFAMASLPRWHSRGFPKGEYLLVSFGLGERSPSPRVSLATEPYPGRWTHHVLLKRPEDVDAQVMAWLAEAYDFSESKR